MKLTWGLALIPIGAGFLLAAIRGGIRATRKRKQAQKNFDKRVAERTREHRERKEAIKRILEEERRN